MLSGSRPQPYVPVEVEESAWKAATKVTSPEPTTERASHRLGEGKRPLILQLIAAGPYSHDTTGVTQCGAVTSAGCCPEGNKSGGNRRHRRFYCASEEVQTGNSKAPLRASGLLVPWLRYYE